MSIKNNNFILAIPTRIKEAIDNQFPRYTQTDLVKIYFLVYKINKESSYQVHSKNHVWMLGLKNGAELKFILEGLKTLKIIYEGTTARIGYTSNTYKIFNKYDYKDEICYRVNYYEGQIKFPIWVQKYVSDGGIVKGEEFSNYKKSNTNIEQRDQKKIINEQAKLILQLQTELVDLKHLIATGEALPDSTNEVNIAHVAKQHAALVKPKELPFSKAKKVDEPDIYTHTQDEVEYKINNYQKLVKVSDDDFQLYLALKKIVNLSSPKGIIITNNKQISITKEVRENFINVIVN